MNIHCAIWRILKRICRGLALLEWTRVISPLSAMISQDAVGAPRSRALVSEFISRFCALAAPEDPPFCNIPDRDWEKCGLSLTLYFLTESSCFLTMCPLISPIVIYCRILRNEQKMSLSKLGL